MHKYPEFPVRFLPVFTLILFSLFKCANSPKDREVLFDPKPEAAHRILTLTEDQVRMDENSVLVKFAPERKTSVIAFYPEKGVWDASGYRFIRCWIENLGSSPQLVELGFGDYDLTLGGTLISPGTSKILKAVIYRTEHPARIDSVFPVMHGKPDGTLRGWMDSACDSVSCVRLIFNELKPGAAVRIGKIWLEEPYVMHSAEELRAEFYPFVDRFGQFMYGEWQLKIHTVKDIISYDRQETQVLDSLPPLREWDRFGGWANGPKLEATGRFRVEKRDGKWWFIDPDGNLFWSHGIDCVEFGIQTRTQISEREHYFVELPPDGTEEAQLYTWSVNHGDSVKMLSFHALNIFRKYGENWKELSRERIHSRFRSWGMNTIGNWSDPAIYLQHKTPYVLTANTKKTGLISDPYAPGFREDLENELKSRQEEMGDPWCLGVFVDNELKWGVKWAPKIPEQILTAPAGQPAKEALVHKLRKKYLSAGNLNAAWGTTFGSWEDVLHNKDLIPAAAGEMRLFMKDFTSLYFSKCREAVKAADPQMLYLGCRMDFHLYPEDTALNYIIKIASEYCDVVSFNRYRYTCSELIPPDGGDYPIIIGEFHFGSLESGLLQPGLRYAADPDERASFYKHYVESALENPWIIGTHWFQLVDQSVTGRPDGENYQAGFLTVGDVPQKEIVSASRDLGKGMYGIRAGEN